MAVSCRVDTQVARFLEPNPFPHAGRDACRRRPSKETFMELSVREAATLMGRSPRTPAPFLESSAALCLERGAGRAGGGCGVSMERSGMGRDARPAPQFRMPLSAASPLLRPRPAFLLDLARRHRHQVGIAVGVTSGLDPLTELAAPPGSAPSADRPRRPIRSGDLGGWRDGADTPALKARPESEAPPDRAAR
jgi:hypothetical protein